MLHPKDSAARDVKDLLARAQCVAESFGFTDLQSRLESFEKRRIAAPQKLIHALKRELEFVPSMRTLVTHQAHRTKEHLLGYQLNPKTSSMPGIFSLHITGTESALAEATLIVTAHTLLTTLGFTNSTIHINSIGIGDSQTRFARDINRYLKKIANDAPPQVRADAATSPLRAFARLIQLNKELAETGPRSIDYLNDEGRTHLWQILEYLDGAEIPYVLDTSVIGSSDYLEHAVFELRSSNGTTLAHGGRYSALGRKAYKQHIPATAVIFEIDGAFKQLSKPKKQPEPHFFFAQLGNDAKKLGLKVLTMLHNANIPVAHTITEGSLTQQMQHHHAQKASYIIIIGHKEALEDAVIVRDAATMQQVTVSIPQLVKHLKKLRA